MNKIAALELFFKGYKKEDLNNFKIELTPPSNVKEITEIELVNQRMTLIATIQQLNLFSSEWILKNILKLSDKEISDIMLQKKLEAGVGTELGAGASVGSEMPGMEMPPPEGEEAIPPEGEEPVAPEGNASPEELAASTIVNMFGKDFLIENKNDFFELIKSSKNYGKKTKLSELFETASDFITGSLIKEKKPIHNSIRAMDAINEFKGLNFIKRTITLYEKDENGTVEKLTEKTIDCGIKQLNE